ncbi:uncharacterized protein LOC123508317 [Portunus trituberculatus]|uniref:uncharacterized protein LOC123508317 n=1 Tax=Portunus trituberculatus TaxID=210409 RepID=UPI001E1CB6D5|nr:uncharacterized protein LOC123508317 [Portunus trituberculatus]
MVSRVSVFSVVRDESLLSDHAPVSVKISLPNVDTESLLVRAQLLGERMICVPRYKGEVLFNTWRGIFSGDGGRFMQKPRIFSFDGKECVPHAAVSFFQDDNVEDCPVCLNTFDDTHRRPRNLPCRPVPYLLYHRGLYQEDERCRTGLCGTQARKAADSSGSSDTACTKGHSGTQQEDTVPAAGARGKGPGRHPLLPGGAEPAGRLPDNPGWVVWPPAAAGGRPPDAGGPEQGCLEAISREDSRVEGRQEKVRQREEALHAMLQELRTPSTRQEAYEVAKSSRSALQAATLQATQTAIEPAGSTAAAAAAAAGDSSLSESPAAASSIADRLAALLEPSLTAEELLRLTQRARGLVEAGRVLAVQDVEGQTRHARISLEHGRLHLHSLQATPLPPRPHPADGRGGAGRPPCEVFLDLAWPGSAARRVVVSLPGTPQGPAVCVAVLGAAGRLLRQHLLVYGVG